ncbi:MAG: hypothetical protein JWO60_919 [Frankiales bacterium]|nr:hypothetical protein [Frankiales bacterium]
MHPDAATAEHWDDVAASQDGVLARAQALRGGLTEDAWDWRLAHDWSAPAPGVAVLHRGDPSLRQLGWGAVLLGGPGACLTGTWALAEQGWRVEDRGPVDVLVPAERLVVARTLRTGQRVRFHRSAPLEEMRHPVRVPPVARAAPAALHAASWSSSDRQAEERIASAVQQRLVAVPALRDALARTPRLPRRAALRAVLADVEQGAHARSELDLLALLRRNGLPRPDRLQLRSRTHRVRYLDAWWERQRVVLEVDGAHHRSVGQWEQDLLRANAVQVDARQDRVLLLRLTGGQLRHDAPAVVAQLRAALALPG